MLKRFLVVSLCLVAIAASAATQTRKSAKKSPAGPVPDAALMRQIWDAWQTLNPANASKFYAGGSHVFFDIAPLQYHSWDEYQKTAASILGGYKSAKFTVDEPEIHAHGDLVWATAIIKNEMTTKAGKVEMGSFRWTVIWGNEDGKWLIVHEHVSAPLQ